MVATERVPVESIRVGDIVHQYGYRYIVRENVYDPHGNTGHSPRHILVCDAPDKPATVYTRGMTLGHSVGALVTREIC